MITSKCSSNASINLKRGSCRPQAISLYPTRPSPVIIHLRVSLTPFGRFVRVDVTSFVLLIGSMGIKKMIKSDEGGMSSIG